MARYGSWNSAWHAAMHRQSHMSTVGSLHSPEIRSRCLLAAACAILLSGSVDRARPALQPLPTVPILMYHHIGDWGPSNPGWSDWVVKPADFDELLRILSVATGNLAPAN